jgi:hypothetical protein
MALFFRMHSFLVMWIFRSQRNFQLLEWGEIKTQKTTPYGHFFSLVKANGHKIFRSLEQNNCWSLSWPKGIHFTWKWTHTKKSAHMGVVFRFGTTIEKNQCGSIIKKCSLVLACRQVSVDNIYLSVLPKIGLDWSVSFLLDSHKIGYCHVLSYAKNYSHMATFFRSRSFINKKNRMLPTPIDVFFRVIVFTKAWRAEFAYEKK